jgi:hypothetical protein
MPYTSGPRLHLPKGRPRIIGRLVGLPHFSGKRLPGTDDEPQLTWPVLKELNILTWVADRCWPIFRRNVDVDAHEVDLMPPKS